MINKQKNIAVKVTKPSILPVGNTAIVQDTGNGCFLVIEAQTFSGELKSAGHMTLWLKEGEFEILQGDELQLRTMGLSELRRHASVGKMCQCVTCYCCAAKAELDRRTSKSPSR